MDNQTDIYSVLLLIANVLLIVLMIIGIIKVSKNNSEKSIKELFSLNEKNLSEINQIKRELADEIKSSRQETLQMVQNSINVMSDLMSKNQKEAAENQDKNLIKLNERFGELSMASEQKLENIRNTMEKKLTTLQEDNNKQLEKMRNTVDEKLQQTLEDRISKSFQLVSERLEQVYKGLGEMQSLASGVGDLKKVLSNVKTRGILGEIQLGAILEQILSKEQYEENVKTKSSGNERVEFAVKLPGDGEREVYLPIDAKFPADSYSKLMDAYEAGIVSEIEEAGKQLERTLKSEAKDIHEKYVEPPYTTDFAIMFLPFEGLYAEAVRRGMVETLQREYKINIAGPTTMAALLNSLQMGFKTLAIQKHSGQVWEVLGAVKSEFDKFGKVLETTQQRINQANAELDKLIGVRTRVIQRKLGSVTQLGESASAEILGLKNIASADDSYSNDIEE